MTAQIAVFPIMPGKVEAWKRFTQDLAGPRAQDFAEMNGRYGLTDHRAWLQVTQEGDSVAIVLHDGPGAADFIPRMVASEHPFDRWMVDRIVEAHALDLSRGPLAPPAELKIDWRA